MECSEGWLEPLLARIASDRSVIAVPVIDIISSANMGYIYSVTRIHGFRWSLIFDWYVLNILKNNQIFKLKTTLNLY